MVVHRSCDRCRLRYPNRRESRLWRRPRYFRPLSIKETRRDNMNTHVNIKARLLLFSPTFVTLSVAVVVMLAMLAFGGPSVQAQTAAAVVDSSITIATNGTVTDTGITVNVH